MMPEVKILVGDVRQKLAELPDESVQCVVTSPPYWGLRDYGVAGQLGLEATPAEYVAAMVEVFGQVRRVLKPDGTLWMNLGDSYAGSGRGMGDTKTTNKGNEASRGVGGSKLPCGRHENARQNGNIGRAWVKPPEGLKPKDLVGIPWRVAFAMQADGWWLRSDIIWHKPSPMPESITDRPTKAHEYIFLLAKSESYFYDAEAIKEKAGNNTHPRRAKNFRPSGWANGSDHSAIAHQTAKTHRKCAAATSGVKQNKSFDDAMCEMVEYRNKRSVWTVPSRPYKEAHFATYPPDLIKPCILAGSRPGDVVLDPFGGSGTTGMVALELGRSAILIELNPEYAKLAEQHCRVTAGLPL